MSDTTWLSWSELPWASMPDASGAVVQFCDRLIADAADTDSETGFIKATLAEFGSQFSGQAVALLSRAEEWDVVSVHGKPAKNTWPFAWLADVLDREENGFTEHGGKGIVAAPLRDQTGRNEVVVLAGAEIGAEMLAPFLPVCRAFGYALQRVRQGQRRQSILERQNRILQLGAKFVGIEETRPLLERIAAEACDLLACDRASIFLWDQPHKQVVACPALGVEDGTLRLPDNVGIVGDVIRSGETVHVADAYNDSRFNPEVDKESGYKTKNLLCVPLNNAAGKRLGAFEVINKHEGAFTEDDVEAVLQLGIQVAIAVQNTQEREELVRSRDNLAEQVRGGVRLIGDSQAIDALRSTITRLSALELPVLILGESGTGKEVVAQSLHFEGPRADKPFVAINCAAIPESLIEGELFGAEKGAYTDARETRQGKFEHAEGGTLFLDELGEMPAGGQAKLLRVLEDRVITRVGGSQTIPIDVRVIAATNVNLMDAVQNREFRQDLYYRLNTVTLELPSLRDRPEDILPLAEHFLENFCRQANRKKLTISAEARRRIQAHAWPGNVRELRNLMERLAFLTQGNRVEVDDLAFILSPDQSGSLEPSLDLTLMDATKEFQAEYIRRSIKRVKDNMSEAAKLLGLHRSNLYRKMKQLGMDVADD